MANTISVNVVGDVRDIKNKLGSIEGQLSGFGKSIGKVGGLLKGAFAFAAGAAVVDQFKQIVNSGSDLQETMSKSATVFGSAGKDIEAFANTAAKSMGLSKQEALAGMAQFGNLFDQLKIDKPAAANMAKGFAQMSSDLASFNNLEPAQVMEAFTSATRGEFDALQAVIPTINAAAIETEALRQTHKKTASQLTESDKVNALYALSVKGMGKANGDFKRTSGGLANQQRILSAQFKNAQATIGTALLPIMTKLITFVNSQGVPAVRKFGDYFKTVLWPVLKDIGQNVASVVVPAFQTLGKFFTEHTTIVKGLVIALAGLAAGFAAYKVVLAGMAIAQKAYAIASGIVRAATLAWAGVQWLLNVALTANPIGIVIVAIGLLVAAIVILWKKNDGFRKALIAAWNAIRSATVATWNAVKNTVVTAWNAVKNAISTSINFVKSVISKGTGAIKSAWNAAWNAVKAFVIGAFNGIKTAVSTAINSVISTVKGIRSRITGAVGDLGGLLKNAGKRIIQGLISGVDSMLSTLRNKFNSITNIIPDWKGPLDKDKKLLTPAGQAIMNGLIKGIDKSLPALKKMLGTVSGVIANGVDATLTPSFGGTTGSLALSSGSFSSAPQINVTVNAPVGSSPAQIGKELADYLAAATSVYGKTRIMRGLT